MKRIQINSSNLPAKLKRYNSQLILCICCILASQSLKAQQEPMYSQYMFNMLQVNPAYAGNRAVDNITAVYRNQWMGINGAPKTGTISWDRRQEESNIGYGLQIYNDRIGIEKTTGIQAFYSYRIAFNNSYLSLGLSAGVLNYQAAFSKVETTQGNDPLFQEDVNGFLPTVGVGALYATEKWYVGLSVPALLSTKINVNNQQITTKSNNHYFLTGGYIFNVTDNFKLKPSTMIRAVSGAPIECDLNLNAWVNDAVGFGVSYRTGDAFVGMFELQLSPQLRLGYAYDYTISKLNTYNTKGTHELMLRYEFKSKKNQRIISPRYY